ncbi:hypothetical protein [Spiroplasma poulsonii]|uniref:hypothetical protein n=1 Tax=Spiroplasma poulsonii TaxID=2138 RepID=UPI001F4C5C38|nr:hypothetical protein [Spiroplasma poulsonii]UNF62410.1 hypothetical protein MNU24_02795 [Spiroplasma poulsonii]
MMLPGNSNQRLKRQNNLILVKKKTHDQNTSNYRTRNQNYCETSFRSEKTWLCFI